MKIEATVIVKKGEGLAGLDSFFAGSGVRVPGNVLRHHRTRAHRRALETPTGHRVTGPQRAASEEDGPVIGTR